MYRKSIAFKAPTKKSQKIWRYMSLDKYCSLLTTRSLYFSSIYNFEDRWEGVCPPKSCKAFEKAYYLKVRKLIPGFRKSHKNTPPATFLSDCTQALAKCCYVNCWYMNDDESAAMWDLYSRKNKGIAIQSTYHDLKMAIATCREEISIGTVSYTDYKRGLIAVDYGLEPVLHKRKSFEHEHELRAVCFKQENMLKISIEKGMLIPVNVNRLIQKVYVHPRSTKAFYEEVRIETERLLTVPVIKSSLYDVP